MHIEVHCNGIVTPPSDIAIILVHSAGEPGNGTVAIAITQFGCAFGRLDNVGEHHRRQDAVDLGLAARSGQEFFGLSDEAIDDVRLEQREMIGTGATGTSDPPARNVS
jgi:hypothetical protein